MYHIINILTVILVILYTLCMYSVLWYFTDLYISIYIAISYNQLAWNRVHFLQNSTAKKLTKALSAQTISSYPDVSIILRTEYNESKSTEYH